MMTQNAHSNTDDKMNRLNALGVHASGEVLGQACQKLSEAMEQLGTAQGEVDKASNELEKVPDTAPIPQIISILGSTVSVLGSAKTSVDGAGESVRGAMTDAQQVGVEGIISVCNNALNTIDAARQGNETATTKADEYQKRLETEAQELNDLNPGASAPQTGSTSVAGSTATSGSSGSFRAANPARHYDRPVSTFTTDGVSHGTKQRRKGAMEGPVIFSAPRSGATPIETGQAQEYIDAANKANREGKLSSTGRVSLGVSLEREKLAEARKERARAERAQEPYGKDVAAHLPDSTWVGTGTPPGGWGRHTKRVNSTLGAQSAQYPKGYQPSDFHIDDSWPEASTD